MYLYSIMPLDTDHADEICEDIVQQVQTGVCTMPLFSMTLVPEWTPPMDKAAMYAQKYTVFKKKLDERDIPSGILVQATIGHGYALDHDNPFTKYRKLTDGTEASVCCPYDEAFRSHMKAAMHTLALTGPDMMMVDDDLRLIYRDGKGCTCDRHMRALAQKLGRAITREELLAHTQGNSSEDERITSLFIETQRDALVGAVKAMREGIDSVCPTLQGAYCTVGDMAEFAVDIAPVLAGKNNPVIVRIHNGRYTAHGARDLTQGFFRAACEKAAIGSAADVLLAETDTCPQNRYSTSAQSLHAHFTGSILEGMNGAKHWITRLRSYEPDSGRAYRKKLAANRGFYEALAAIVPTVKWRGCRVPVSTHPGYGYGSSQAMISGIHWATCVLERFGLPLYFGAQPGGAVFLDGEIDTLFTDEEFAEMFRGPVFLSSNIAAALIRRGFGDKIGVRVRPWQGAHLSGEIMNGTGNAVNSQQQSMELIPVNDTVTADSTVYHLNDQGEKELLFPGTAVFAHDGTCSVTFCGTPKARFLYTEAFSFLNESRKKQFIRLLKAVNELPVYYPGDAEVYLRAGELPDGQMLVAFFNIGLDPIEEIELVTEKTLTRVQKLLPNGEKADCTFDRSGEKYVLHEPAWTLEPVILFLS